MDNQLFRKKSLDRISSPEQLDEYLHVTNPILWILLLAVIIILAGLFIWASFASVESYVTGTAVVEEGRMTIQFDDSQAAQNVKEGMTVQAGAVTTQIQSIGSSADGRPIAGAVSDLADGSYQVRVYYRTTQILKLLFN